MSDILGSLPLSSSKEKMLKVGTKKGNQWRKKTPKREKRKQTKPNWTAVNFEAKACTLL